MRIEGLKSLIHITSSVSIALALLALVMRQDQMAQNYREYYPAFKFCQDKGFSGDSTVSILGDDTETFFVIKCKGKF